MRVLFVAADPPHFATTRYRCAHVAEALGKTGVEATVAWAGDREVRVDHDVVVLHRVGLDAVGERFVRAVRARRATLVYSTDDLTFETEYAFHAGFAHPDDPLPFRARRVDVDTNRRLLQAADAVLVSTEFLAARARRVTDRPVYVLRNALGDDLRRLSDEAVSGRLEPSARGGRVTLGYLSGSPTHDADLADVAGPLARVLRRHENANLLLVGAVRLPHDLEPFAARVRRHPFIDWRDLPALLALVDVNLAPTDPTRPFNHAKSEIKFLEAAAAGVPTVTGATAGVVEAVEDGVTGCVVRSRADWEPVLGRLIDDEAARSSMGEAARARVITHATTEATAQATCASFGRLRALSPYESSGAAAATVVRRPFSPTGSLIAAEKTLWRRWARLARHVRLVAAEQRGVSS